MNRIQPNWIEIAWWGWVFSKKNVFFLQIWHSEMVGGASCPSPRSLWSWWLVGLYTCGPSLRYSSLGTWCKWIPDLAHSDSTNGSATHTFHQRKREQTCPFACQVTHPSCISVVFIRKNRDLSLIHRALWGSHLLFAPQKTQQEELMESYQRRHMPWGLACLDRLEAMLNKTYTAYHSTNSVKKACLQETQRQRFTRWPSVIPNTAGWGKLQIEQVNADQSRKWKWASSHWYEMEFTVQEQQQQ